MSSNPEQQTPLDKRLERLRTLTDVALAHLSVETLLVELLDRVLEVLGADTAAVLLLNEGSHELVARAARGIEEEVRQGVRVPLGRGFAGRIAAEKRPIVLTRVDSTTVANPILWEKGIRAMLGVPLLSGGHVIGVLHVGSVGDRQFSPDDIELLQLVADRMSGAVQAGLREEEHAAAQALQRSLLPTDLPECPGLEFAARYAPADQSLGGDWYDVFILPSGQVWAVSGDVQGHGFRSAVVMGRLRSIIRAYAMEGHRPEQVIDLTDRKLQHFEPEEMATVLCAVLEPPYEEVWLCSAGHPPPVLAIPDRPSALVEVDPSPPLGAMSDVHRASTTLGLSDGAILFLYTDGLIERRSESIEAGLERVRDAVIAEPPAATCHRVMARLVADTTPEDDIAILAIRRVRHQPAGSKPIAV
jgi:putative methionine-R-sulfoxide reductase with GAF domain